VCYMAAPFVAQTNVSKVLLASGLNVYLCIRGPYAKMQSVGPITAPQRPWPMGLDFLTKHKEKRPGEILRKEGSIMAIGPEREACLFRPYF